MWRSSVCDVYGRPFNWNMMITISIILTKHNTMYVTYYHNDNIKAGVYVGWFTAKVFHNNILSLATSSAVITIFSC